MNANSGRILAMFRDSVQILLVPIAAYVHQAILVTAKVLAMVSSK